VRSLRYPVRWHRVEAEPGIYDWAHTDAVLGWLHDNGMRPIVDLVHHMSIPRWLDLGFADPRFPDALLRFYEAFAQRYPWVPGYTLFNEPFTTMFLAGAEGLFPPYLRGTEGFVRLTRNVLPAVAEGSRMYRDLLPGARHVHLDPRRPFLRHLAECGGEDLLAMQPGHIDVLGLDYYAHSQWRFSGPGVGAGTSPEPGRLDDLICEYHARYALPVVLGETNIRGHASDRASWFKYTLEQCENAAARGVPVEGYCWFPFIDSCDWASLLRRADRCIDPVGVFWLDESLERHESSMSRTFAMAAQGTPARNLPAYRFRRPVRDWVAGYLPQMEHWDWQEPPDEPECTNAPHVGEVIELPELPLAAEPPPGAAYEQ
jgi:beta-glucosidase/6-phospho-beta-glucosidase/beta-galactosidase